MCRREFDRIGPNAFPHRLGIVVREWLLAVERCQRRRRVVQHESVGAGADVGGFARLVKTVECGSTGSDVSPRRTATSGNSLRIDAEFVGVGAEPADGTLSVLDAVLRLCVVPGRDAVLGRGGHHAARGEIAAVLFELLRGSLAPCASKEENDCGPGRVGLLVG